MLGGAGNQDVKAMTLPWPIRILKLQFMIQTLRTERTWLHGASNEV